MKKKIKKLEDVECGEDIEYAGTEDIEDSVEEVEQPEPKDREELPGQGLLDVLDGLDNRVTVIEATLYRLKNLI